VLATGLILLAASFLLMVTVGAATSLWLIMLWAVVGRIGLGFVLPSLNLGAMRGLPDELISQGASTINFLRQLGGAVGISLVGIVLEWRLQAQPANPCGPFTRPSRWSAPPLPARCWRRCAWGPRRRLIKSALHEPRHRTSSRSLRRARRRRGPGGQCRGHHLGARRARRGAG
jgi:MFS family permease